MFLDTAYLIPSKRKVKKYLVIGLLFIIGSIKLAASQASSDSDPIDLITKFEILHRSKEAFGNFKIAATLLNNFSSFTQNSVNKGEAIIENEDPKILKTKALEFKSSIESTTIFLATELKQFLAKEKNSVEKLKHDISEWSKEKINKIDSIEEKFYSTEDRVLINTLIESIEKDFDLKVKLSELYSDYLEIEENLEAFLDRISLIMHDIEIKIAKNKKDLPLIHDIL